MLIKYHSFAVTQAGLKRDSQTNLKKNKRKLQIKPACVTAKLNGSAGRPTTKGSLPPAAPAPDLDTKRTLTV